MLRPAVLASLTRSGRVESVHRGAVAIADADGRLVASAGSCDQPCYYRSACKPMQLVPCVRAGAVERFGLEDRHLAVMMASHSGAPWHVEAVRDILTALGMGTEALGCGYHVPRNRESMRELLEGMPPSPLYNNCSGKHAGMLALSVLLEVGADGYLDAEHGVQQAIVECVAGYAGIPTGDAHLGTDGCSAPTLYAPLRAMAEGFARFAEEMHEPGSAAHRIAAAAARAPEMLGEDDDFQVHLERELGERLVGKYGAEGLFCVALPEKRLGLAVRIEDGGARAIGAIVLDVLLQLGVVSEGRLGALAPFREPILTNWRGTEIGTIRSNVALVHESTPIEAG